VVIELMVVLVLVELFVVVAFTPPPLMIMNLSAWAATRVMGWLA